MSEWRKIPDYPDYEVSNFGSVRSLKFNKIKYLSQASVSADGAYRAIELWKNKQGKRQYIHRLVLKAFVGPPPTSRHECNHIDGDKSNNKATNLEWTTSSENKKHGVRNGLYPVGDECPWAKLTSKDVTTIKAMRADGMTYQAISEYFPVSRTQIGRIMNGKRWKQYG